MEELRVAKEEIAKLQKNRVEAEKNVKKALDLVDSVKEWVPTYEICCPLHLVFVTRYTLLLMIANRKVRRTIRTRRIGRIDTKSHKSQRRMCTSGMYLLKILVQRLKKILGSCRLGPKAWFWFPDVVTRRYVKISFTRVCQRSSFDANNNCTHVEGHAVCSNMPNISLPHDWILLYRIFKCAWYGL